MTSPCVTDPAQSAVQTVVGALLEVFDPSQICPPKGGGGDTVRFFAGDDTAALAMWDAHAAVMKCRAPFLWVRSIRRYRSKNFPEPTVATDCALLRVIALEIGVARCANTAETPRWDDLAQDAAASADDAWRIEETQCMAMSRLRSDNDNRMVAVDTLEPYGPAGGVFAWTGIIYVSYG